MTTEDESNELPDSTDDSDDDSLEPTTFDADYVSRLRSEAAEHRRERRAIAETLTAVQSELAELRAANLTAAIRAAARGRLADPEDLDVYVDRATLADDAGRP